MAALNASVQKAKATRGEGGAYVHEMPAPKKKPAKEQPTKKTTEKKTPAKKPVRKPHSAQYSRYRS
ncbi:hypothetical protein ACFCYB_23710 [Streptomyces sp. NPDC056309]|uniref:hypothetical protein n=1 Tax=unclassified Streptomyces TaxID=2593676 RepID=UPI0035DE12A4